jgi:Ca2+-transporting ATPase
VTTFYNLEGEMPVERNQKNTASDDALLLAKALILSSDATFEKGHATGDPTEIALLLLGDDLGIERKVLNQDSKRINEYSFDSDRKLMSTLVGEKDSYTVYTKGAIAGILSISTHVLEKGQVIPITEDHREQYRAAADNMANNALRTLGVAYKPADADIPASEMEQDLILAGLVGMIDPPRPEVRDSIQKAKTAGITTLMITGDHKNTAFAIALELEIAESPEQVITGHEIDGLSDKEFADKIERYRVFARVSPEHKVKIVRALKSLGNVVSMTGDGVNDAPSLHAADIGVAMGITGTDVAKGASDMILADDNFATIVTAIAQGRNIYNNIRKTVVFLLTCNLGEVVTIFVAILIGWSAPLIATQLLWINLITDTFPAIALGMDPDNPDVMNEKPRDAKESFFAGGAGLHVIMGGLLIGTLTILAFCYGHYEHGFSPFDDSVPENTLDYARTMAFLVLVFCQLFYSLATRNSYKSIFRLGVFSNKYLIGAIVLGILLQMFILLVPITRNAFHLQMPDLNAWIMIVLFGLVPLLFNEIFKIFIRARLKRQRT